MRASWDAASPFRMVTRAPTPFCCVNRNATSRVTSGWEHRSVDSATRKCSAAAASAASSASSGPAPAAVGSAASSATGVGRSKANPSADCLRKSSWMRASSTSTCDALPSVLDASDTRSSSPTRPGRTPPAPSSRVARSSCSRLLASSSWKTLLGSGAPAGPPTSSGPRSPNPAGTTLDAAVAIASRRCWARAIRSSRPTAAGGCGAAGFPSGAGASASGTVLVRSARGSGRGASLGCWTRTWPASWEIICRGERGSGAGLCSSTGGSPAGPPSAGPASGKSGRLWSVCARCSLSSKDETTSVKYCRLRPTSSWPSSTSVEALMGNVPQMG